MKNPLQTDTLIVGAGPAGLAIAGRLQKQNTPFLLLEKAGHVAASWHQHYDRLCLHTVKEHSNLPFADMPANYPTYVKRLDMIAYWKEYLKKMNIVPLFGQNVSNIKRSGDLWETTTDTHVFQSRHVVVATGYNRVPLEPAWEGLQQFKGPVLHSSAYRNAKPFAGKKVLIVGMGNTGAELAIDLYENGAFPSIAVRSPVNFIRREILGRPAQKTAILLGKLPSWAFDFIARQVQKITVGDLSAYGIQTSPYSPSEALRRFGKVPIIDIGTIDLIKQGHVKIWPGIQRFSENSVTFNDGRTEDFDAVILCTGYRAQVEDFIENAAVLLNERGYPRQLWFEEKAFKGLYFCGFSTPISGILRNIKLDSAEIAAHIAHG